jgi:hypothetical protein
LKYDNAEELGKFLWEMNAPVWEKIQMQQAIDYTVGNYMIYTHKEHGKIVGCAVWHDDENNVRILDSLAFNGHDFHILKSWFQYATDTTQSVVLHVQGKHKKLTDFYLSHGFVICEETPYSYIMKKEGGHNGV